jgi:hypothetical protein
VNFGFISGSGNFLNEEFTLGDELVDEITGGVAIMVFPADTGAALGGDELKEAWEASWFHDDDGAGVVGDVGGACARSIVFERRMRSDGQFRKPRARTANVFDFYLIGFWPAR